MSDFESDGDVALPLQAAQPSAAPSQALVPFCGGEDGPPCVVAVVYGSCNLTSSLGLDDVSVQSLFNGIGPDLRRLLDL